MRKSWLFWILLAVLVPTGLARAEEGNGEVPGDVAGGDDGGGADDEFYIRGSAEEANWHRIGRGEALTYETDVIRVAEYGNLEFARGSRYGGGGSIVLDTAEAADNAALPVMFVRGSVDDADGGTGAGTRRLFADTTLRNGVVRIGGDIFGSDLELAEGSAGGTVRVDTDATFSGRFNVRESALDVSGTADRAVKAAFGRDVTAGSMSVKNAHVTLGEDVERLNLGAGGFTAGDNSSLTVNGDTVRASGSMIFGKGSRLNMGLNTLEVDGRVEFEAGSVYSAQLGAERSSLVTANTVGVGDGAVLYVGGLTPEEAKNRMVIAATEEDGLEGMFKSDYYELKRTDDGQGIEVARMRTVDEVTDYGKMSESAKNAAALFQKVLDDENAPEALRRKLADNMEKATIAAGKDAALGEVAKSQVFAQYAAHSGENARAAAQNFTGGIGSRLTAIHTMSSAPVASGAALASAAGPDGCVDVDADRFWIGGFGAWTRQHDRGGQFGYNYDTRGVIMGQDWQRGDLTIGVSGAFSSGDVKDNGGYTRTDVETVNLGLYAAYDMVGGMFVDGNIGYGHSWNKTRTRVVMGGEKTGRYANYSFGGGANVGYNMEWKGLQLTPTAGFQWTHVHQNGWTEAVSDDSMIANWFEGGENDYVEIPLALRASRAFQFSNGTILTPEARAAWIYNAGDSKATVRMGYAGSAETATLYGIDPGRHRALVGGGVKANFNSTLDAFVDYNYEFRGGYRNNNFKTGLGVSF